MSSEATLGALTASVLDLVYTFRGLDTFKETIVINYTGQSNKFLILWTCYMEDYLNTSHTARYSVNSEVMPSEIHVVVQKQSLARGLSAFAIQDWIQKRAASPVGTDITMPQSYWKAKTDAIVSLPGLVWGEF